MPHLHLIVGPVAAGKSTYAIRLAREHRAVRLTLDRFAERYFRERTTRSVASRSSSIVGIVSLSRSASVFRGGS